MTPGLTIADVCSELDEALVTLWHMPARELPEDLIDRIRDHTSRLRMVSEAAPARYFSLCPVLISANISAQKTGEGMAYVSFSSWPPEDIHARSYCSNQDRKARQGTEANPCRTDCDSRA